MNIEKSFSSVNSDLHLSKSTSVIHVDAKTARPLKISTAVSSSSISSSSVASFSPSLCAFCFYPDHFKPKCIIQAQTSLSKLPIIRSENNHNLTGEGIPDNEKRGLYTPYRCYYYRGRVDFPSSGINNKTCRAYQSLSLKQKNYRTGAEEGVP